MTRINLDPPSLLIDQHLLGELHEIGRVWPLALAALDRLGSVEALRAACPATFRLGAGHVCFFFPRLGWLADRHRALVAEALSRGWRVTHTEPPPVPEGLDLAWTPTADDWKVSRPRLVESIGRMKRGPTYRGERVGRDWYSVMAVAA